MVLNLIKKSGIYNITNSVTKIEWSGSASQAARQLAFDYINAPFDNFNAPAIETGDYVSFEYGQEGEVFYGQIFGTEKSSVIGTITYTAFDMMKNLLASKAQYNFKKIPAETIAKMVCDDAQIPIRFLYPTEVNVESLICNNMSLYDIIMAAYTKVFHITGDKFFPMIYKRGLGVYKAHWAVKGFVLSDNDNISEASIEETMDEIVNRVKIYDAKGTQIGEVNDDDSLELFGTFQETYKQEKGVDPTTAAKKLIKVKPEQTIKLKSVGDINCLSCYFVTVKEKQTGLNGKYWIYSDKHTWENGAYTMELELKFEAIMEKADSVEKDKVASETTSGATSGSGSGTTIQQATTKKTSYRTGNKAANTNNVNKPETVEQKTVKKSTRANVSNVSSGRGGSLHGGTNRRIFAGGTSSVSTGRGDSVHGGSGGKV